MIIKKISAVFSAVCVLVICCSVYAESIDPVTVNGDHITIRGNLPVWDKTDISLRVFETGKENESVTEQNYFDVINHQDQTLADENGDFVFDYDMSGDPGQYFFCIEARGYKINYISSFMYYGSGYIRNVLDKINLVKKSGSAQQLKEIIEENINVLKPDARYYDKFVTVGEHIGELYESIKNMPEVSTVKELEKQCNEAAVITDIRFGENADGVCAVLAEASDVLGLDNNDIYNVFLNTELISGADRESIASELIGAAYKSAEELTDALEKSTILTAANSVESYGGMRDIINAGKAVIPSSKYSEMAGLKYPENVYLALIGKTKHNVYQSIEELAGAVDAAVDEQRRAENATVSGGGAGGSGRSGGSGGSGFSSGHSGAGISIKRDLETEQKPTALFSDMEGYEWANDAVEELYRKNIISGVGNGMFMPGAQITREEFVKMIVAAFGISASDEQVYFSDVKTDEWYYPYIASAYSSGLVKGVREDMFGTGENITREDMAVICCRVMPELLKSSDAGADFFDFDEISDYASNSVSALYHAGIIKGMNDNRFVPQDTAIRAQAAVIISRMISVRNDETEVAQI